MFVCAPWCQDRSEPVRSVFETLRILAEHAKFSIHLAGVPEFFRLRVLNHTTHGQFTGVDTATGFSDTEPQDTLVSATTALEGQRSCSFHASCGSALRAVVWRMRLCAPVLQSLLLPQVACESLRTAFKVKAELSRPHSTRKQCCPLRESQNGFRCAGQLHWAWPGG